MTRFVDPLFQSLAQNPASLRLGSALLHFVWQGAALAAIAAALLVALRHTRPQLRYAASLLLLGLMAACPIATFLVVNADTVPAPLPAASHDPPAERPPPSTATRLAPLEQPTAPSPSPGMSAAARSATQPLVVVEHATPIASSLASTLWTPRWNTLPGWLLAHRHWIVAAWLAGVGLLTARLAIGLIGAERARRCGLSHAAAAIQEQTARLARQLGLGRAVRVAESALVEVPTLVGWLAPIILLPATAISGLTAAELEAILAHELAHVRRHDYLVNLLQTVVETILFYHPAVWWLSRRVRQEREHCCDDIAIALCGDRIAYARALTTMEELRASPRWAIAARGGSLIERIRRIVVRPQPAAGGNLALVAIAGLLLVTASVAIQWRAPARAGEQPPAVNKEKPWSVFGLVTDADGKPMPGVTVRAHAGLGSLRLTGQAETDADGKYAFELGPGIWSANNDVQLQAATIAAHKPGFFEKNLSRQGDLLAALKLPEGELGWGKKHKDDVILPGQKRELNFVMLPAAKVAGTLIDKDEQPLAAYSVSLTGEQLPPSSSVMASVKIDGQGRFTLADVPTGFAWQLLIEPAKREPPWNAWASGRFQFAAAGGDNDVLAESADGQVIARRFELQLLGDGVNWKEALRQADRQQKTALTGQESETNRLRAENLRLILGPAAGSAKQNANSPPAAAAASKTNLRRTKPDAEGKFTVSFDNPLPKAGAERWKLDPEKNQVVFQIFVRNADGKLVEKIFKQLPAREVGGFQVNVQVKPELIEHSSVSLTFVTIQPNHDEWVKAFFHDGKGTSYRGLWSTDGGKLAQLAVDDQTTGWIAALQGDQKQNAGQEQAQPQRVAGQVVDADGKPVAAARIWWKIAHLVGDEILVAGTSDEHGHFELTAPANWESQPITWKSDMLWVLAEGKSLAVGRSSQTPITLNPASDISFQVVDEAMNPIAGAEVEPWHFRSPHGYDIIPKPIRELLRTPTDASGIAKFPPVPRDGFFSLQVKAKLFGTQEIKLVDRESEPAQRTLMIRPVGGIEGRLVTDQPRWARGVKLWFRTSDDFDAVGKSAGFAEVTTDDSGRFAVPTIAAGKLWIEIREAKDSPVLARLPDGLSVKPDDTLIVIVPLEQAVVVRGTIRTEGTARPVAGAKISVRYGTWRQGEMALSDAEGRFQARVLPGSVSTQVIELPDDVARGYVQTGAPWNERIEVPAGAKVFNLPPIVLSPTTTLAGALVDHRNQPVAAALVHGVAGNRRYGFSKTDADGRFSMKWPGKIAIEEYQVWFNEGRDGPLHPSVQQHDPLVLQLPAPAANEAGDAENGR